MFVAVARDRYGPTNDRHAVSQPDHKAVDLSAAHSFVGAPTAAIEDKADPQTGKIR